MSLFYKEDGDPRASTVAATIAAGLVAVVFVISLFAAFPFKKTPRDKIGLSYGGGVVEGAHFQKVVQPGSGLFFNGWGDRLYLYPVTQRNYIISKRPGEGDVGEVDFVSAPSSDRIEVQFEVAVYFKLNVDNLQAFHENIGLKYRAWEDDGWLAMLHSSFRQQIEYALQREARKYAVIDIYADKDTLETIQTEVGTALKENVERILGDEYFCGPTFVPGQPCPDFEFVIKRITVPDEIRSEYQANRASEIAITTKENEVKQAQLEAQAIKERQEALESCGQTCVLYEAIHQGGITFWVIPDGQTNLTIPAGGVTP